MTTIERICQILELAAAAPKGSVNADTALTTLDGWDSMGVVFFLGEAAVHWPAVRLSTDALRACLVVGDLARLVDG